MFTVQSGDTLAEVSRRTGAPVCMLARVNGLPPGPPPPGTRLTLDPTYCMRNGLCAQRAEGSFACMNRGVESLEPGESVFDLARRAGVPVRLILLENDLDAPGDAQPGEPLAVPERGDARLVTLSAPETPHALAGRWGVDARELMYLNRIPAGTTLMPGQQVLVP